MNNDRKKYISTATTTTVKSESGYLKKINITETAAGAITVYNGPAASADIVALFKASIAEGSYDFGNIFCPNGIYVVTAAGSKLTVIFE